jgi:leucyl-tRNA synthetase
MKYDHKTIEKKWQIYWEKNGIFQTPDPPTEKFYALEMFAYPSGDLHLGHCKNYVIGDVFARFKRRMGYDVLHPFGWDAFGLPAENRAIKLGKHPEKTTLENITISKESFKQLGISYDWDREITTCLPDYYKWTQWMFLLLYRKGLAYKKEAYVNWCPSCQTVLANEQVTEERCYRCNAPVTKRKLNQWFFKITDYADRLLHDLDTLDGWQENIKTIQRGWIGRSEGCSINFKVADSDISFDVFTTRPDTIFGVTFLSIAPEHEAIEDLIKNHHDVESIRSYVRSATLRTSIERAEKEKDGVFTGSYAINPLNNERVPIYVADYVLLEYGSGVVMGVPAHDERDFQFAKKYDLPIRIVIRPKEHELDVAAMDQAFVEQGVMVNSGRFNGMDSKHGIQEVTDFCTNNACGGKSIHYRLKDWLISRQRYWGAPIPILYCDSCGTVPVPEQDLPVVLPRDIPDYTPKGKSPLAAVDSFIHTTCPKCGGTAKRDPDTMDTFVCSSWYFLRYIDAHNENIFCEKEKADTWLPIDQYTGGSSEHATGHLIYFRFFTKVLFDAGYISVKEPATNLFNLGMLMKDGVKMSSSKGNLVPVRRFIDDHGADVARLTVVSAGPPERESEWTHELVVGSERFINRIYRLVADHIDTVRFEPPSSHLPEEDQLLRKVHQTIAKVTNDCDSFKFNTAIAAMWELLNELYTCSVRQQVFGYGVGILINLLSPFAPHLADELWSINGQKGSLASRTWPSYDPAFLQDTSTTIVIQINGKVRAHLELSGEITDDLVKNLALKDEKIQRHLQGKSIKKTIYVPNKLLNIVV